MRSSVVAGLMRSERGVGSKRTQPWSSIHSSTQEWALRSRTTMSSVPSAARSMSPGVNPRTTREGMPRVRAITAIEVANCSQYPVR